MKAHFVTIILAVFGTVDCVAAAVAQDRAAAAAVPEVCAFIASAYNRGEQGKLWGYPDPVDIAGDGKLRHVYIVEQGTAHVQSLIASTKPLTQDEQDNAGDSEVDFYSSIGQDMPLDTEPHIFAFKGVYYVVYETGGGPYDVVKPNTGELCTFKRRYTAVLSEDHAHVLCAKLRAGEKFDKLRTQKLASAITVDDAATLDLPGPFSPTIARYAKVKLDPAGGPVTAGYFTYESTAGRGCDAKGVVLLDGQNIEKSPRNTALLAAEADMVNCNGSDAFVVDAGGEKLIEIDGGAAEQRKTPPRMLVRLNADKIEKVCNVEQHASFTPQPATAQQR